MTLAFGNSFRLKNTLFNPLIVYTCFKGDTWQKNSTALRHLAWQVGIKNIPSCKVYLLEHSFSHQFSNVILTDVYKKKAGGS
jgi:hypothetical protein